MPQAQKIVERKSRAEVPENSTAAGAIKIALADDHTIFRDGLRRLLSLEPDFEVVAEAKDGSEVLNLIQEKEPDILLLDLRMPGVDGLSLLQRVQAQKMKPGFPFWPWHGHSIHPRCPEYHVFSR